MVSTTLTPASTLQQLDELLHVAQNMRPLVPQIDAFLPHLVDALENNARLLTCGNGGSAADAMHLAEELVGRYRGNRRAYSAISLASDAGSLTCIANDWDYSHVFSRQVEAHGREGDWLVVFTTSGHSANVLRALETARKLGLKTVGLLGKDGGKCKELCNHAVIVPSQNTARIQEIHGWLIHIILEAVEARSIKG